MLDHRYAKDNRDIEKVDKEDLLIMENKDHALNQAVQEYIGLCKSAVEIVKQLQAQDWSAEALKQFCSRNGIEYIEDQPNHYDSLINELQTFDYSALLDGLEQALNFYTQAQTDIRHESYNQPYLTHMQQQISAAIPKIQAFNKATVPPQTNDSGFHASFQNYAGLLFDSLVDIEKSVNPNLDELFEHFKYGDKNYVIFGKNGAGKTTLLHKIALDILTENSVIIPADRTITIQKGLYYTLNKEISFNQELSDKASIEYLLLEMESKDVANYQSRVPVEVSIQKRLYTLFGGIGIERYISVEKREAFLSVAADGERAYPLADGSDGERTVVYMILAVLLAPLNAYIFIDEPENHLNGQLMRNLFDGLEQARPDARFIYLTHKTDFIESRKNIELIYLSKTDKHNEWSFKELSDYEHIDLDIILNIEGAQSDILFCEGNNTSSIDSKILDAVFPEYTIKPVGSCNNVKGNTIAINAAPELFRRKATGVVDGDYQTDREKQSLIQNGVYVLSFNEWENILLDPCVINAVNQDINIVDTSRITQQLIGVIKGRKTNVMNDFLNKRFLRLLSTSKLSVDQNLEDQLDQTAANNKMAILEEVDALSEQFDRCITDHNYGELVGIIPGKMFINEAAKQLGLRSAEAYISKVLTKTSSDSSFRELLKRKINLNN